MTAILKIENLLEINRYGIHRSSVRTTMPRFRHCLPYPPHPLQPITEAQRLSIHTLYRVLFALRSPVKRACSLACVRVCERECLCVRLRPDVWVEKYDSCIVLPTRP